MKEYSIKLEGKNFPTNLGMNKYSFFRKQFVFLFIFLLGFGIKGKAQFETPDWLFWLAFEDATGAKDTVWIAMDEEGTFGQDVQFGEMPQDMNEEEFHAYFGVDIQGGKSDILVAPISIPPSGQIFASNYVYPITLSWDTTLFNAPILMNSEEGPINNALLDNEYFFNYHQDFGAYHMLFEESVEMPEFWWGSMDHFPLWFISGRGFGDPQLHTTNRENIIISFFPNPTREILNIETSETLVELHIYDLQGKVVFSRTQSAISQVDISSLSKGLYMVEVTTPKGSIVSKVMKID